MVNSLGTAHVTVGFDAPQPGDVLELRPASQLLPEVGPVGICRHYFLHNRQIENSWHMSGILGIIGHDPSMLAEFWELSKGNFSETESTFRLALARGGAGAAAAAAPEPGAQGPRCHVPVRRSRARWRRWRWRQRGGGRRRGRWRRRSGGWDQWWRREFGWERR